MSGVAGRVWTWINPWNLYRPWGREGKGETSVPQVQERSRWRLGGLTSWVWAGWRTQNDQKAPNEEYWEAQEELLKPLEVENLNAERPVTPSPPPPPPPLWRRLIGPVFYLWPPIFKSTGQRKSTSDQGSCEPDAKDPDFSDYDTPPPSPLPLSQRSSTFHFFARSWSGEIVPEHYEICFNFLRHLFDLFVVGFLWTVSPPAKFVLDVLGVQGALKLWLHGMAMFLVSSVGMAGLLWLVQEYLPQFALVYGIVQALVISVSVRQSVILGTAEDGENRDENSEDDAEDAEGSGKIVHVS